MIDDALDADNDCAAWQINRLKRWRYILNFMVGQAREKAIAIVSVLRNVHGLDYGRKRMLRPPSPVLSPTAADSIAL